MGVGDVDLFDWLNGLELMLLKKLLLFLMSVVVMVGILDGIFRCRCAGIDDVRV